MNEKLLTFSNDEKREIGSPRQHEFHSMPAIVRETEWSKGKDEYL